MSSSACYRLRASYIEISKLLRPSSRKRTSNSLSRPHLRCLTQRQHRSPAIDQRRYFHIDRDLKEEIADGSSYSSVLGTYKSSYNIPKATSTISQVPHIHNDDSASKKVVLHGYLRSLRDLSKNLIFATFVGPLYLEEIQIVSSLGHVNENINIDDNLRSAHAKLRSLRIHTPIAIEGYVKSRSTKKRIDEDQMSPSPSLEDLEVVLQDVHTLNDFPTDLIITPETAFPPEQRHLQLRLDRCIPRPLILRSEVKHQLAEILQHHDFTEVETPLLFKSTSEGAREFIVPTRRKGLAYALPQSPQQFKQILMAGGIPRYYQFARCFRDEDLRADRQPEFTQLDLEMAFSNEEHVIRIIERLITKVWNRFLGIELPNLFPRLTYERAMSMYGSDKPDLRIPISPFVKVNFLLPADLVSMISPLKDPIIEAMVIPLQNSPKESRDFVRDFMDSLDGKRFLDNPHGGPGVFIFDSSKPLQGLSAFGFEAVEHLEEVMDLYDGHLIILQARPDCPLAGGSTSLGDLRLALHNAAIAKKLLDAPGWKDFKPLWITDFPLFSPCNASEPGQGGHAGFASTHHPFTAPKTAADVDLLLTDPTKATGNHYDLVINGEEIGGGSQRIHHAKMQEFIFREILKMKDTSIAEFSHLLEALQTGCPPHAGIALGFDRLVAMIHSSRSESRTSLRDVIAFPKSGRGEDLMVKSPGRMSKESLETYHLRLRD